jgi:hypothetical protein
LFVCLFFVFFSFFFSGLFCFVFILCLWTVHSWLSLRYSLALMSWLLFNFNYLSETSWSWSYDIWIYSYLCNQCISPLKLCIRIPLMARCTRYNIMGGVFFSVYSGFLQQLN